jgi:hypothetical protein
MPDDRLWTAKDVAAYLNASVSWVYLHADAGTLPSVKVVGLRRFIPTQIRAFAAGDPVPPLGGPVVSGERHPLSGTSHRYTSEV